VLGFSSSSRISTNVFLVMMEIRKNLKKLSVGSKKKIFAYDPPTASSVPQSYELFNIFSRFFH
jgi:hypothetical protein